MGTWTQWVPGCIWSRPQAESVVSRTWPGFLSLTRAEAHMRFVPDGYLGAGVDSWAWVVVAADSFNKKELGVQGYAAGLGLWLRQTRSTRRNLVCGGWQVGISAEAARKVITRAASGIALAQPPMCPITAFRMCRGHIRL